MRAHRFSASFFVFLGLFVFFYQNCANRSSESPPPNQEPIQIPPTTNPPVCGDETFSSDVFIAASINGQNNWQAASLFDEEIVNLGSQACRGQGVWKISNSVSDGGFGNQPASPELSHATAESVSQVAGDGDSSSMSFFFRSVHSTGDGSLFGLSLSPSAQDRFNLINIINDDDAHGGLQIVGYDFVNAVNNFESHSVAKNLGRGAWHHLKVVSRAVDGRNNDVVKVYLDGQLLLTMSSWEDFFWQYRGQAVLRVNRAMFRMAPSSDLNTRFPSGQGGFYIDDFKQQSFNNSDPSVILNEYHTGFEP